MNYDVNPQYLANYPYYGRHGQDKFLYEHLFSDIGQGVFVDIGAYDGVESSNTLFFEESLGWKGMCIEPLKHIFPKLVTNRNSLCKNVCALDRHARVPFQHVVPRTKKVKPNIEKMSGLLEYSCPEHREMIEKMFEKIGGHIETFDVTCVPINELFEEVGSAINLLSIDTEGSEESIVRAIDFSRFRIDVIVIETLFPNKSFSKFMEEQEYVFLKDIGYDWIYTKKKAN